MMGLHFGHRNDEVGFENRTRQPECTKTAVIGFQLHFSELVPVEIHELDLPFREMRLETCRLHYEFRVALMSGALADHNSRGAKTEETPRRGANQSRVRVHRTRQVFYQVWF